MMNRRTYMAGLSGLATVAAGAAGAGWVQSASALAPAGEWLDALKPSARQPVLFVGHGSPMNVLPGNAWRDRWELLGQELLQRPEPPQLILCISAHWLTREGWYLTGMDTPRTIHDFGGFPQPLYEMQYPAPGAPQVARQLAQELHDPAQPQTPLGLDPEEWGLDHGTWSVLLPMFPQARIPVIQLSIDYLRPLSEHYALGRQLRHLRERGVLIVGSGNIVHNLRRMSRDTSPDQAFDWAHAFDQHVHQRIASGDTHALVQVQQLGETMRLAHPTHDHYLPLLYAAGAAHEGDKAQFFNTGFQHGSISMQSVLWG